MQKEIEVYLENLTKLLNGQLRGAINAKARSENKELIQLTLIDAFEQGKQYGETIMMEKYAIENLKQQLNDGEESIKPIPPENTVE